MPKNKKLHKTSNKKTNSKWSFRKVLDIFDSQLYYQVTTSSKKRYNSDSIWQTVKNNILCGNNRRNISKRVSKAF